VYQRYLQALKLSRRVAHERLALLCFIDYDREMALVADHKDLGLARHKVIAVGRLVRLHGRTMPSSPWWSATRAPGGEQRSGLGTELLRRLLEVARGEGLRRVRADILPGNVAMQRVCAKLGLRLHHPTQRNRPVQAETEL
jgi:acetyltransferase